MTCDCCAKGLIEKNCPYKYCDFYLHHVTDVKFCLKNLNGEMKLRKSHQYYYHYQVQGQLSVCEVAH